ncbi:MAG: hypothetical protein ACQRW7_11405 [Caulobacterales bacterium]|uniref:hypothetical protein n=1 Tax=Glycocaulis sp. TaxID=1969725 RepID=UPI003F9F1486
MSARGKRAGTEAEAAVRDAKRARQRARVQAIKASHGVTPDVKAKPSEAERSARRKAEQDASLQRITQAKCMKAGRAAIDPAQASDASARKARDEALRAVRKALARRVDTADMDPFTAMARGLVSDGKHLRALAPTRQLGQMATPSRNRPALFSRGQLAALYHYHDRWQAAQVGLGAVDPQRIRVDGGGGGDATHRHVHAIEALREYRRLKAGLGSEAQALILEHVLMNDRPLPEFCIGAIYPIKQEKYAGGARIALLIEAADSLRRQLGY